MRAEVKIPWLSLLRCGTIAASNSKDLKWHSTSSKTGFKKTTETKSEKNKKTSDSSDIVSWAKKKRKQWRQQHLRTKTERSRLCNCEQDEEVGLGRQQPCLRQRQSLKCTNVAYTTS